MMTELYHLWTITKEDPLSVILLILTIVYVANLNSIYKCEEKEEEKKPPRKLTKKERKRIEKAIDDAYKRMR